MGEVGLSGPGEGRIFRGAGEDPLPAATASDLSRKRERLQMPSKFIGSKPEGLFSRTFVCCDHRLATHERKTITVGKITIRIQSRAKVTISDPSKVISTSTTTKAKQNSAPAKRPRAPIRLKPRLIRPTCIHRGDAIGKIDYGCRGLKPVYECNICVRPNTLPTEPAFCTDYKLIKYFGIVLCDGTQLQLTDIPMSEIIVCDQQHCDWYRLSAEHPLA